MRLLWNELKNEYYARFSLIDLMNSYSEVSCTFNKLGLIKIEKHINYEKREEIHNHRADGGDHKFTAQWELAQFYEANKESIWELLSLDSKNPLSRLAMSKYGGNVDDHDSFIASMVWWYIQEICRIENKIWNENYSAIHKLIVGE